MPMDYFVFDEEYDEGFLLNFGLRMVYKPAMVIELKRGEQAETAIEQIKQKKQHRRPQRLQRRSSSCGHNLRRKQKTHLRH